MSPLRFFRSATGAALAAVLALLATSSPAHAVVRTWNNAGGGSAGTTTNWTPNGLPAAGDNVVVGLAGAYAISFPVGSVPTVISQDYRTNAIVNLTSDGLQTTSSSFGVGQLSSAGINILGGSLFRAATLYAGGTSTSYGRVTLTSSGIPSLSPTFTLTDSTTAAIVGGDGKARLEILGGAAVLAEGAAIFGNNTTAVCSLIVVGRNAVIFQNSQFQTTNPRRGNLLFGSTGNAFGRADNGGFVRIKGNTLIGAGPNGRAVFQVGASTTTFSPSFYAEQLLRIGDTGFPGQSGGGADVLLKTGFFSVGGLCTLGDPDGNTALAALRVHGGTMRLAGGFTRHTGTTFEHRGGTVHFPDGNITWPGFDWHVSSTVGSPILWFSNGRVTSNVGSMGVGRSGAGMLRVSQPGTQLLLSGSLTVGDSLGGTGSVELDSSAVLQCVSPLSLGRAGGATVSVRGGSRLSGSQIDLGVASGSSSSVSLNGPGTEMTFDQLHLGGSGLTPGGAATLDVDSSAVAEGGLSGSLCRVLDGFGSLSVRRGGLLRAAQILSGHQITLDAGTLHTLQTNLYPPSTLTGRGTIIGDVSAEGVIDVATDPLTFGQLRIQGDLGHSGETRLALGRPGGERRNDSLTVSQQAALFGTLVLERDPSFQRIVGDSFVVMTWASRVGTFDNVLWLGGAASDSFDVVYEPTRLLIITKPTTLGADPSSPAVQVLRFRALAARGEMAFALELPDDADVRVTLHDVTGRLVARVHEGALAAGVHRLAAGSRSLPGGVYFARAAVTREGRSEVRSAKVVRLR